MFHVASHVTMYGARCRDHTALKRNYPVAARGLPSYRTGNISDRARQAHTGHRRAAIVALGGAGRAALCPRSA